MSVRGNKSLCFKKTKRQTEQFLTFVWAAQALAINVLPVPGGPYSNTPWKNLMISTCISKKLHLHRTVLSIVEMFLFKSISLFEICVDVFCFASCHFILDNRDLEQF